MSAVQPDVFISFAREDQSYADLLKGYLLARDREVWSDDDIEAGEDWADAVTRAVEDSRVVLLLLSRDYLASHASLYEAGIALAKLRHKKGKVIPILVGEPVHFDKSAPLAGVSALDARQMDRRELFDKLDRLIAE